MKPRILFLNVTGTTNKGDTAVVISHIKCIRDLMPEAEITLLSGNINVDRFYEQFQINVRQHPWYRWSRRDVPELVPLAISSVLVASSLAQKVFYIVAEKLNKNWRYPLSEYDLVLDIHADRLNESFHGFRECVYSLVITWLGKTLIGKPMVIGPTSIGPLKSRLTRWMARYVLNRVDVITTREALSKGHLASIGVNKPRIELTADMAFVLDPASPNRVNEILENYGLQSGKPLVGIVPRMFLWTKPDEYYQLMAESIDFIVERLNAEVCLIPHEQYSDWLDKEVCQEIQKLVRNQQALTLVEDTLDPREVKGILSRCDLVITWKLHGAIAAVSSLVPTVALFYGDKFRGILGDMMNQEESCIDLREAEPSQVLSELKSRIESVWEHRAAIAKELALRAKMTKELAESHGKLVKELSNSHGGDCP